MGKRVTLILATGAMYDAQTQMASFNFVEPYLRSLFSFLGVTDITFITAGGTMGRNSGLDLVVHANNAFHVVEGELGDRLSTEVIAGAFSGARIVKAFNHLAAVKLGAEGLPSQEKQVILTSSNDPDGSATTANVATQVGFAPVGLGRIDQGDVPLHVVDGKPRGLLMQNLVKFS